MLSISSFHTKTTLMQLSCIQKDLRRVHISHNTILLSTLKKMPLQGHF